MPGSLEKLAASLGLALACCCASVSARAYTNSISLPSEWKEDGTGDPFVLKYNGVYYLYCSTGARGLGYKYWTSLDGANWTYGGIACNDPFTVDGYAPEVVYWNGTFYMYTSPQGNGHYVLTSASPGGPFVRATGNQGHSIDGHVFIDDDGSWFFFNAGGDGLHGSPMSSPTVIGPDVLLGGTQISGQWTEAPAVFKRNGKYYLTETGNHVLSKGYRVNAASSSVGPLGPYTPSSLNPILLSSEGPHVGLGHNGVFIGPDLDTYYTVYHNLTASYEVGYRKLNLDALGWNGDQLVPYGPTTWAMPDPARPDFEDRFQRASVGAGWANQGGGAWGIANDFLTQSTLGSSAFFIQYASAFTTGSDYTAEYNVQEVARGSKSPKLGAVFGYVDAQNYGYALVNGLTNQLQTNLYVAGQWGTEVSSPLPAGFDSTRLHTIRIEKSGTTYKFFVDSLLKETKLNAGLGAGHVGYLSQDDSAKFGYLAASKQVNGSGVFELSKPIPGVIRAVHYRAGGEGVGFHDTTPGNAGGKYVRNDDVDIRDTPEGGQNIGWNATGEWYAYSVNVEARGTYNVGLRYATTGTACKVRLWLDNADVTGAVALPSTGGFDQWQTFDIKGLELGAGKHTLRVETVSGEFDFASLAFSHADNAAISVREPFTGKFGDAWGFSGGSWSIVDGTASIDDTGKRTLGSAGWTDYTVECDIKGASPLNTGLMVRVQNPAQGGPGDDPGLGTDFYQGYFIGLSPTQLVLGKQNYDWAALASAPGTFPVDTWHHLRVVVSGNRLEVYVGNATAPSIDYTDNDRPFISGKVGLRSQHAHAYFDNLEITGEATPSYEPIVDGGVDPSDAGPDAAAPADAGTPSDAGSPPDAAIPNDAAPPTDAGKPSNPASLSKGDSCGCRTVGRGASSSAPRGALLVGVSVLALRRRRFRAYSCRKR